MASGSGGPRRMQGSSPLTGTSTRMSKQGVKRPHSPVLNGLDKTCEDVSTDYLCPVCLDLINEAYITKCGHTFCHTCLDRSIDTNGRCPKCNFTVYSSEDIFPNHMVNQQIIKHRRVMKIKQAFSRKNKLAVISELKNYLSLDFTNLEPSDLQQMISMLTERKEQLESKNDSTKYELLKNFLVDLYKKKEEQLNTINQEMQYIKNDIEDVDGIIEQLKVFEEMNDKDNQECSVPNSSNLLLSDLKDVEVPSTSTSHPEECHQQEEGFNVPLFTNSDPENSTLTAKIKRMKVHFDELVDSYFTLRIPGQTDEDFEDLAKFGECLNKFTQYTSMRPLATIDYAADKFHSSSNIASSIEFDKDSEYFAVAGLTKKIRIFDFGNVIRDPVDLHYPCTEMQCDSKISCVSWSSYLKNNLASSDYEGTVTIWDAVTTEKLHVYQEHQKRCWSVDFNKQDTKLVASGSDDARVKLWHLDSDRSIKTLEAKANVCCVQFNPSSRHHLAFGSADHWVHYYDLRNLKEALRVFKGHRKAVSYVKFITREEIVSASTDSQLKIWNVNSTHCAQSLQGHTNEKNFVGLATDGEYVACGSENNSLYVYYKGLPKKLFRFRFDQKNFSSDLDQREDDTSEFVSAVCWRKGSNVVAAGNSQGVIKILQIV